MDQDTQEATLKQEEETIPSSSNGSAEHAAAIPAVTTDETGQSSSSKGTEQEAEVLPDAPSTPEEEKNIIKEAESQNQLRLGDTWYIISGHWWKSWKEYVSYDYSTFTSYNRQKPGPINNDDIIEYDPKTRPGGERIKKSLMENYDFVVVHSKVWKILIHWYGGGPPLPRRVISQWSNLSVEIRPFSLKIVKSSDLQEHVVGYFSKMDTVGHLKNTMCAQMELNPDNVRVWDYHSFSKFKLLDDLNSKLEASQIIDGQPMLLEEKDEEGKWPASKSSGYSSSSYSSSSSYYSAYSNGPSEPGVVGMSNLGNTCFMNSSLQCLSNTKPLTNYFVQNTYKVDVNEDNPLGTKGELAESYASLLRELWTGNHSAVAPRDFKYKLERFAPQFAGYQQHDSQELLGFLLDGLHEDLNRVKKKPYKELKDPEGRPEKEVADEMWEYHKLRNNSIVVDWFQGQLKSTLVCPDCSKVSITFDPFMYLSLPLPSKNTRSMNFTFFGLDQSKPLTKYGIEVEKSASISDMKAAIAAMTQVQPSNIAICDVFGNRFYKIFSQQDSIDSIQERDDIYAYELEDIQPPKKDKAEGSTKQEEEEDEEEVDVTFHPVVFRKHSPSQYSYHSSSISLFGIPNIVAVPNSSTITYKQLYDFIFTKIRRFLKVPSGENTILRSSSEVVKESEDEENEGQHQTPEDSSEEENEGDTQSSRRMGHQDQPLSELDGDGKPSDELKEQSSSKKQKRDDPIFILSLVDQSGTSTLERLVDNDQPLRLRNKITIGVTWNTAVLPHLYDEKAEKAVVDSSALRKEKKEDETVTLQQCIDLFTTTEKLGPKDPWFCNRCKDFKQATKKFDLWRLPPTLVVHLKRFSYRNSYYREKLDTFVDYPLDDLDLSQWVKGELDPNTPPIYQLYAVSNHFGSMGGGHYTAYAKNKDNGKWYQFDDSYVSSVSNESNVKASSAYVLFYQRKDTIVNAPASTTSTTTNQEDDD